MTASPRGESKGRDGRTCSLPRATQWILKRLVMQDLNLQQVADLITANTIFTTKEVLTSEETARYLGVSKSCLYKWTMSRQIPHYKSPTGKLCFFNRAEVEAWMQSQRVATEAELETKARASLKTRKR